MASTPPPLFFSHMWQVVFTRSKPVDILSAVPSRLPSALHRTAQPSTLWLEKYKPGWAGC